MKNNDYYPIGIFLHFSPSIFYIILYIILHIYTFHTHSLYSSPQTIIASIPLFVAFITTIYAFFSFKKSASLYDKLTIFLNGSINERIAYFYCSLIGATTFTHLLAKTGIMVTIINLHIIALPSMLILPFVFSISSLISITIRSWLVSIILYIPIIFGLAISLQINPALMIATAISGIICGYQISLSSIYTLNNQIYQEILLMIIPPSICTLLILSMYTYPIFDSTIYTFLQASLSIQDYLGLLPILLFLGATAFKIDLLVNLAFSSISAMIMGIFQEKLSLLDTVSSVFEGFYNQKLMVKLLIFLVFLSGFINLITQSNGFNYFIHRCKHAIKNRYITQITIVFIISIINLITAFDILSIDILSPITKSLSHQYNLSYQKITALLYVITTTSSCFLPYAPIILLATYLSHVSCLEIISYMFYPILVYLYIVISIFLFPTSEIFNKKLSLKIDL